MQNVDKLLYKELDQLEKDYASPIMIADGLELNYQERLKMIEYYINSRYLNQEGEEFDVPFMNVVNANADVSKVASDFDTKDIRAESDDGDTYDVSFVFNKEIQNWMEEINFAKTLNEINSTRADYGEVLAEKVIKEVNGEKQLFIEVPEWQNLEVDASDMLNRPIIVKSYMSPADFAEKKDVWDNVKEVLKIVKNRKTGEDNQILVKKITGKFPVAVFKDIEGKEASEDDEFTYARYCFYVACLENQKFYLYGYEEDENPFKKLAWKKKAKRPGVGVIEEGIPAQIWTNDVIQKEHAWFELASKWVGQSASRSLKGRNILSETENGTILEHDDAKPITTVSMVASAVPEFQNLIEKWGAQYERATSTYDSVRGETPPSGQAFRLQALIQQQGATSFDQRREEMGIFITEVMNDWVLPFLAKKINKAHILASDYTAEELKSLDANYANYHANQKVKEMILGKPTGKYVKETDEEGVTYNRPVYDDSGGQIVDQENYDSIQQSYLDFIGQTKEKRFLDIPKDYYKNFKPKISVDPTGEQKNKMAILDTISNVLTLYMSNPQVFQSDPTAQQLLSFILEKSGAGVSPISLGLGQNKPVMPVQAGQPTQPGQPEAQPTPQLAPQNERATA